MASDSLKGFLRLNVPYRVSAESSDEETGFISL
jgi:hypothetical protein